MSKGKKPTVKQTTRNIKAASKQTKKQAAQVSKSAKSATKAIKKIVKTVKTASKAASKKAAPQKPTTKKAASKPSATSPFNPALTRRRSYRFRDLPITHKRTIIESALELERHPELDGLRKPGEMWGFDLAGGKSTRLFENIQDAASYLASYKLRQDVDTQVERVKFVKFDSGSDKLDDESYEHVVNKYQTKRKREVKRRMETEEKEYQAARDFVAPIIGRKPTRRAEVIKGLLDVNKTLADKMAAMEKQLAKLSKQINGGKKNVKTKPAKKKVSGKVTGKKAGVSKATTKGTKGQNKGKSKGVANGRGANAKQTGKHKHGINPSGKRKGGKGSNSVSTRSSGKATNLRKRGNQSIRGKASGKASHEKGKGKAVAAKSKQKQTKKGKGKK